MLLMIFLTFSAATSAASTAFVNVNLIPMTSEIVVAGQTVVVEDGIIVAIGGVNELTVPESAKSVDGSGRYLMPGLAEMHAHVPDPGSENFDRYMVLFVANGVTTIRGMLGQPSHLSLRQQILNDEIFGPRLITSGPSLNGNSVSSVADGKQQVIAQQAAGYDFLKIHPGLSLEEFTAIAETANELGIPFAGHVPSAVSLDKALSLGMASIEHLDGYMPALLPADSGRTGGNAGLFMEVAAQTAKAGSWNVPTQSLIEHLATNTVTIAELRNRPEMHYMPRKTVQEWLSITEKERKVEGLTAEIAARAIEVRRKLILALHESGAGLLLGSDAPQILNVPGFSIHRELELIVAAGLTPFEALQTGTTAVAEYLGTNTGAIAVGREADLILLDTSPLVDITNSNNIHGVMLRGTWLSKSDLHERLSTYRLED
jgi:imidazolonepropionase-like amidohydrolase